MSNTDLDTNIINVINALNDELNAFCKYFKCGLYSGNFFMDPVCIADCNDGKFDLEKIPMQSRILEHVKKAGEGVCSL